MLKFVFPIFCAGLVFAAPAKLVFHPTDWPAWRGLHGNGHAQAVDGLPLEWSARKNVVWKTPILGRGHSTPTIVGSRIYLATAEAETQVQSVLCLDKDTGKLIWTTAVHKGKFVQGGNKNASQASSAVVCDGERLYVSFPNDKKIVTSALSLAGKLLWQRAVTDYKIHQGFGTSPMVYKDVVVAKADSKGGGAIAGLNKKTGAVIWKHSRPKLP